MLAALFSFSFAFAETGTEVEPSSIPSSNKDIEGQCYTIAGTYNAGGGSSKVGNMTSKGFKCRTGSDGKRVVFTVSPNYTITKFVGEGISNYDMADGAEGDWNVKVTKVEVDGTEVQFTGGEFPKKGASSSGNITIDNIQAKQSIAIYFDNSNSKGTQINLCFSLNWERADATQPAITVSPKVINLIPTATYKMGVKVDPNTFTTNWLSNNEAVATVAEDGTVTAVAAGTAKIINRWADDATVADTADVTVNIFDTTKYKAVKEYDFKSMGAVTLAISEEAAANIWNEANNKTNAVFFCTNEGLENIAVQAVVKDSKGWSLTEKGLFLAGGAGRCAAIGNLKAGQIVEIIYTGDAFYTGSKNDAVRKDDGATKTALNESIGRAIYLMGEDGFLGFEIAKGNAVEKIIIYEVPVFDPATAIKNANFEGTPIDNHLCGYGKDMGNNGTTYYGLLDIEGWQKVVVSGDNSTAAYPYSGMGGAVFAYGTEYQLRGNSKAAPAEGPEGTNGKALGFFGVWGCGGYYYQEVTLPAGTYTLNIPMYNQSGTQANESYTGFFVKDSDVKYTVAVNPAVGAWTVQSVNFTLETETTGEIRVGYKSTGSGSGANPMLFIDGVQLLTELDGAKALYNTALAAANAAAADEVVTGEEKTTLNQVIAANSDVDTTSVEALKTAATALNDAVATFNAAKADYQELAELKTDITMVNYNDRFTYASADKKTAAETALNAEAATSAADAKAKAEAIRKAYRAFADSHAMAEGVEGAVNMTDKIANPNAESAIADPWTLVNGEGSNGSLVIKDTDQEPLTDGEGNTYKYFDGGNWGANAWNVALQQNVNLPAGKYLLTVAGRAASEVTMTVFAGTNERGIPAIGSTGGLFGRGWNNADLEFEMAEEGNITIGVKGETETIHNWMSFTRFRLVQLEATAVAPVDPNDFTSYIVNADLTGEGGFDATGTKGIDGSGIVKVGNAAAFDFKQTIANLPAGKYKVTAQAAYRYGADEAAEAAAIAAETDTKLVQLYATVGEKTVSSKVQNRYDGASETDYANGDGSVTVNEKFVPNSSDAVKAWFAAGQYVNEVIFNLPADGDVTIGINRTGTPESDYTVIGPWTLTRLGDAEVEPEPEPIYIETDLTAQFNSLATTQWTGSSGQVGWAAPKVTTNSGLEVAAWERYNGSCDWTGDIMSSSVTGLTPGTYKIELYGAAAFTFGRGFGSTHFTGDFSKDTSETYNENDAITENTGVTLFAETSEGLVSKEIPIWYATNFNTAGIATATLENVIVGETGTIKIGLSKTSTSTNWHVVQLKGVTAQVDAVGLHANELAAAKAALNAEENAIVTGEEKTALETAINENATVAEQTADAYKAAIKALSDATAAFTGAKAAYQSLIDAKAYLVDLPYADAAKKPVVEAATSATDATAKTEALMVALRAYYESNAIAEGVEGAQILTDSIKNPKAEDGINNWTVVLGEGSGGNIDVKNNEPWTDAAGVAEHKYFDGGNWGAQAWDVALEQKIALPAGKFLLTTIARASGDVDFTLYAGADSVKIAAIGAAGGMFNRGWNNASVEFELADADSIVIGVRGVTNAQYNWMSFSDFRLVQLEKPVVVEPIEGISYSWESPAGKPIEWGGTIAYVNGDGDRLNYQNSGYYSICLNGKKANINDETASANAGKMVITLDKAVAEGDTIAFTAYITKNTSSKASAWIVYENGATAESEVFGDESNIYTAEGVEATGAINTKYTVVSAEAAGSKTITLTRGQTGTNLFITKLQIIEKKSEPVPTGISTVKNSNLNGTIFNLNGQKMNKAQKGLYIINGKKVVIK